jgi:hypothetical protein
MNEKTGQYPKAVFWKGWSRKGNLFSEKGFPFGKLNYIPKIFA